MMYDVWVYQYISIVGMIIMTLCTCYSEVLQKYRDICYYCYLLLLLLLMGITESGCAAGWSFIATEHSKGCGLTGA